MARTSTAEPSQERRRRELVEEAMQALKSKDLRARRWSIALAARYRRMIGPYGVYNRAAKFSELRQALKKEGETARELAPRMTALTARMQIALSVLLVAKSQHEIDQQVIDDAIFRRYEVAWNLKLHADEVERLMKMPWPKGGDWDLAKAHFGPPKRWLAGECIKVFFHHGDTCGIRPLSGKEGSPFGDYVGAIYELGTGEEPWGDGVGLAKIVNRTARGWRRNEKRILP